MMAVVMADPAILDSVNSGSAVQSISLGDVSVQSLAVVTPVGQATTGVGEPMPANGVFTVTWAWAQNRTFSDFDPATDKLALDWFGGSELQLTEVQGNAVLKIPAMQQSYTLSGSFIVTLIFIPPPLLSPL
jgi:hypothetical protein